MYLKYLLFRDESGSIDGSDSSFALVETFKSPSRQASRMAIDLKTVAAKWQAKWDAAGIHKVKDKSDKPKFYNLEMFPYPSAYGLHMGHVRNYSIGDTIARYKRMTGYHVLYPMGFDAFGLPAENAAIKNKIHPKTYTEESIKSIQTSMKRIGLSYDWDRMIATCYPEYYKWNQLFFLKFYEKGLAYRKKAPINWCPSCNTVLANEQVEDGKCWRCSSLVQVKDLEQWFFKITAYAEELLNDLATLQWPERIKLMQKNWIGKSEGTLIHFAVDGSATPIQVFTTRPDTLMGVTYVVLAPEHPMVASLIAGSKDEKNIQSFIREVVIDEKYERAAEDKEKKGMFLGRYALHPLTGVKLPIYIANFVLMDYGTGAIMSVPAHDARDHAFALKYQLPIKQVIKPAKGEAVLPFVDDGILVDSGQFTGQTSEEARKTITQTLAQKNVGNATVHFKLRDWLLSRQRYWGTPIPIVYCDHCGIVPVPEKQLPIQLPENVEFTGKGNPLANTSSFVNCSCPKCKKPARRETDTMDTFVDSSWYYLRYCSPSEKKIPFKRESVDRWMPVDQYIGGAEHAVMHLLYARFFAKVLRDLGYVGFDEPFQNLFNQGIVHKDGQRMSKSKGNVVSQEDVEQSFGIDTARLFLLFVASPGKDIEWSHEGAQGCLRFLLRVGALFDKPRKSSKDPVIMSKLHATIKAVTSSLNEFELNKGVLALMELVNVLEKRSVQHPKVLETLSLLLAPFVPHVAEECWEQLGKKPFACKKAWPTHDEKAINPEFDYYDTLSAQLTTDITELIKLMKLSTPKHVTVIIAEPWKYEFFRHVKTKMTQTRNPGEIIKELMAGPLKAHGEQVVKMIPQLMNNPAKMPLFVFDQKKERSILSDAVTGLSTQLGCPITVIFEKESTHQKAKNAWPGKPALVIE